MKSDPNPNRIVSPNGTKMDPDDVDPRLRAILNAAAADGIVDTHLLLAAEFEAERDMRQAIYWYERAASEPYHNVRAMRVLVDLYEYGTASDASIQDIAKACQWIEAGLEKIDDEQVKVPWMTKYGFYLIGLREKPALPGRPQGTLPKDRQDAKKGLELLERAADLGNVQLMLYLGHRFMLGRAPPFKIDRTKGMKYLRMGAEHGCGECAFLLGTCYCNGLLPIDEEEAKYWFEKAIGLGCSKASEALNMLRESGPDYLSETTCYTITQEYVDTLTALDDQSKCYNLECKNEEDLRGDRFMVCSKCRCVKYCSKACQKAHWNEHKMECKTLLEWRNNSIEDCRARIENRKKKG